MKCCMFERFVPFLLLFFFLLSLGMIPKLKPGITVETGASVNASKNLSLCVCGSVKWATAECFDWLMSVNESRLS